MWLPIHVAEETNHMEFILGLAIYHKIPFFIPKSVLKMISESRNVLNNLPRIHNSSRIKRSLNCAHHVHLNDAFMLLDFFALHLP